MEDKRLLKTSIFIYALLLSVFSYTHVFAYSAATTHPALTDEIVDFYNHFYPSTFTNEEKQIIKWGSSGEDDPAFRVLNHFYDPVYEVGLLGTGISAKAWAQSAQAQAVFSGNVVAGVSSDLYSADSDYSWERSIYEYVYGDKKRGLTGLGHALHIIEDMTVPSHVRNDQHLSGVDESPYETWTSQYSSENITTAKDLIAEGRLPIYYNTFDDYIYTIAFFTNTHFFSKDTLPFPEAGSSSVPRDKYPVPNYAMVGVGVLLSGEFQSYGASKVSGHSYRLFELREKKGIGSGLVAKKYRINIDKDYEPILEDYWQILSREAVVNGAGVIKLFFDEVEKEKQTHALKQKNKSFLAKIVPDTKAFITSAVTKALGHEVDSILATQNTASVAHAINTKTIFELEVPPIPEDVLETAAEYRAAAEEAAREENAAAKDTNTESKETETTVGEREENPKDTSSVPESTTDAAPTQAPDLGGNGQQAAREEAARTAALSAATMAVASPESDASFATTTLTFSGTAHAGDIISQDFSDATTTTDADGAWTLMLADFSQGTTTVVFIATNPQDSTTETADVSVFIDSIAPTIENLTAFECSYSLRTDICMLGSGSVSLLWEASGATSYGVFAGGVLKNTTTATSSTTTLASDTDSTLEVVAYDAVGNTATSTSQTISVVTAPLVINEVAWAGTAASASDEWIELYNKTNYKLDLSHVVLYTEDLTPYLELSGTVSSGGYYLIERSASSTTSVAEDMAVPFSGVGGGSGLSNSGEVLVLAQSFGGIATSTLDQTPTLASCNSSWCGGSSDTTRISMERVSSSVAGTVATNWGSNNTYTKNGMDALGGVILGTPKAQNSISLLSIGYYCPSETSGYTSGGSYAPTSGTCTYLSDELSGSRYGDLYRGTLAHSTLVNGHSLSSNSSSTQQNDTVSSPVDGESLFAAIYEVHVGSDVTAFRNFFKAGANAPPHLRYGMLSWKYSVPVVEVATSTSTTTSSSSSSSTTSTDTSTGTTTSSSSTNTSTATSTPTATDTSTSTTTSSSSSTSTPPSGVPGFSEF